MLIQYAVANYKSIKEEIVNNFSVFDWNILSINALACWDRMPAEKAILLPRCFSL